MARPAEVTLKLRSLDHVQVAEAPISALTVWQAVFERARLARGWTTRADPRGAAGGAVGGETLEHSWGVLKKGGTLVTIAAQSEGAKDPAVRDAFFIVAPSHA